MMRIVDFRFDWENSKIIICMVHCDTGKYFYIHEKIDSEQEADDNFVVGNSHDFVYRCGVSAPQLTMHKIDLLRMENGA